MSGDLASRAVQQRLADSADETLQRNLKTIARILRLEEKFPLGEAASSRVDPAANAAQRRESEEAGRTEQDPNITRREIVVDLALAILGFCWSHELSALKSSTFFSLVYTLHSLVAERPGPAASLATAAKTFDALLLKHSLERPPFSICCFSSQDVELLTGYVNNTYLRQLKLYQLVFGTRNELHIEPRNSRAEVVDRERFGIPPPSLATAAKVIPVEGGADGSSPPAAAAAGASPSAASASNPASLASPPAAAPSATAASSSAALSEWWNLDHALSYFPHTSPFTGAAGGSASGWYGSLPLGAASPLLSPLNRSNSDDAAAGEEDDEFRDSTSVSELLEAQAAAAEALAQHGGANGAAAPLFASAEDQALFDAALAREMHSLRREVASAVKQQQDVFARRLQELETAAGPAGAAAREAAAAAAAAQGGANSGRGSGDKGRASKSRGKPQ